MQLIKAEWEICPTEQFLLGQPLKYKVNRTDARPQNCFAYAGACMFRTLTLTSLVQLWKCWPRTKETHGWLAMQSRLQPDNCNGSGEGRHWKFGRKIWYASVPTGSLETDPTPQGYQLGKSEADRLLPKQREWKWLVDNGQMGGPGEEGKVFLCCLCVK